MFEHDHGFCSYDGSQTALHNKNENLACKTSSQRNEILLFSEISSNKLEDITIICISYLQIPVEKKLSNQ